MLEEKIKDVRKKIVVPLAIGIIGLGGLAYLPSCGKSACCEQLECSEGESCGNVISGPGDYCLNGPDGGPVECCNCYTPECVGKNC